jgi:hypothetical protein
MSRLTLLILSMSIASLGWFSALAQDERARMQLDYFSLNNTEHQVNATVKTKEDRSYVNVPDIPVMFFMDEVAEGNLLARQISDKDGRAVLRIPGDVWDTLSRLQVVAAILDHERFKDYSRDIEIVPAKMSVEFMQDTSRNTISVEIMKRDSARQWIPAGDVAVKVYAQRMFGELPVSVDFNQTNDDGQVLIEFPKDIPGDQEGIIEIIVKVQDHELLGNLIYRQKEAWGTTEGVEQAHVDRELWSARSNAPMYLVLIVNGLILGIWFTIAYIIYNMLRILRKGNHQDASYKVMQNS